MRTIPPEIRAELESSSPRIARTLKLTCKDGTTYGFTDHELPLLVDGLEYVPAPGLNSVKYTATADTQVSNQNVSAGWVEVPEEDLRAGKVDNAEIVAGWVSWVTPEAGTLVMFQGRIGEITYDESGFAVDVVSFMKALERNVGWTYTSECRHRLYSLPSPGSLGGCMADPTGFTFTGTVTEVVTPKWKLAVGGAAAGKEEGFFSAGQITFTSGLNNGLSTIIKTHSGNTFELFLPTAFVIPVGTTFTVQAGCDKKVETCKSKFSNIMNFGGYPHLNPNVNYR